MGGRRVCPVTSHRRCRGRSPSGCQGLRPPGHVQAQGVASRGAVRARRVYAADGASEGGLQDDPLAGAEVGVVFDYLTDDLVAHHEGRRGYRGEVRRVFRGERSQVRAADTGEERLNAYPLWGREPGVGGVFQLERGEAARFEGLYPLRAGAHQDVARDGLSVDEGVQPRSSWPCRPRRRSCPSARPSIPWLSRPSRGADPG